MEEAFFEEVDVAIRLVRRRKRKDLGELAHLRELKVVQDRLQGPLELMAPAYIGGILESLIKETVTTLKPLSTEDSDNPDWRNYILLQDYFVLGEPWKNVADRLGLSRTRFFEVTSLAIEALALALAKSQPTPQQQAPSPVIIQHNLPRPMYQFVQRADEQGQDLLEKAMQGLMRRPWVVSIRGFPGAGKTTLALEVAQRCMEKAYFDAIIWIAARTEREGFVTSLDTICNTIGQVLGDRRVVAAESLADKQALAIQNLATVPRCLLIIDNTEVLTDEQHQEIYHFVQQVPMSTSVLLTSRERGRASELETVIKLFGMGRSEGIAFMQNFLQARGIASDEADLRYVYEATSGIPSAMRMALGLMSEGHTAQEAVRSDIGQVEELLEFLLEEGYSKLTDTERKILHVMPLFLTPVPLEIISAASGVEGAHLRLGLNHLRTLFLLREHEAAHYDILAPTRFFLQQHPTEAIKLLEPDASQGELTTPYHHLAEGYQRVIQALDRPEEGPFIREQCDNLLAVMGWCYAHQAPSLTYLLEVTGSWLGVWGYKRERVEWGQFVVEMLCQDETQLGVAAWHLVYNVGWTHFQQGDPAEAQRCFQEGLDLAGEEHQRVQGVALRNLAQVAREYERDYPTAQQLYQEALAIFVQLADQRWVATCKGGLGVLALLQNDLAQARLHLTEAHTLNKTLGEIEGSVSNISDLAQLALAEGKLSEAEQLLSQSQQLAQAHELPEEEAYAKVRLAHLREQQDRLDEACDLAQEAYEIYERVGLRTPFVQHVDRLRERLQGSRQ